MNSASRFALVVLLAASTAACGSSSGPSCSLEGGQPLASSAWPKFRADLANTGRSTADLSSFAGPLREVWKVATGGPVVSSPAIGPLGEIFIGSADSRVYRIEREGVVTWQALTLNSITTGPALDAFGRVFVTSNDGNLYTFDAVGGSARRPPVQVVGVLTSPTLSGGSEAGVAYVGSLSAGLLAVCPNNVLRWASQFIPVGNVPAVDAEGGVYLAGAVGSRTVIALDPTNGQQRWLFTATATINAAMIAGADGSIYVVDGAGRAFAVDADTGTSPGLLFESGAQVTASPALGADGTLYVADLAGRLTAYDTAAGDVRWIFLVPSGAGIASSPAVTADGTVVFGADDGFVYAVGSDGELRWSFETGGAVRSSPAIAADGTIYVGSADFNVYALRPD